LFQADDMHEWRLLLDRLVRDENGQDLVEYALLTTAIGLGAIVAFNLLQSALAYAYGTYTGDSGSVNGLWESPAPGAGS